MIRLKQVSFPDFGYTPRQESLSDNTMALRLRRTLEAMARDGLDVLAVYADLEHGSNFEYLTGFLPRFEEAVLVLHADGRAYLLLGNENTKMVNYARLKAELIHVPFFSLPDQPMDGQRDLVECFRLAGIEKGKKTGLVGWKRFTARGLDNARLFDVPHYLTQALFAAAGEEYVVNAAGIFIHPGSGVRCVNNANEIAHYAYGSDLSGRAVFAAMEVLRPGIREVDLGQHLGLLGQRHSVVSIAAAGQRFEKANLYPSEKQVAHGDKMSLTAGFRGGLTSRAGYALENGENMDGYLRDLVYPYFSAVAAWLEDIAIGMTGGELYELVDQVLPKHTYRWSLNPGHLTAEEEWMCSPVYPGSQDTLKSGMLLQIDIIPSVPGYAGAGCESGVALADDALRRELDREYPELWQVITARQDYIRTCLGIRIPDWVLPLSDTVAYYPPFFLNREFVLAVE